MIKKELFKLLEENASDIGVTFEEILEVLKKSLAASAKKLEPNSTINVKVNVEKHEIVIQAQRKVVEELSLELAEDEMAEITLEEAKKIKKNATVGDIITKVVSPKDDFGRQSARSAKSTFASNLKALLREKAYKYFKEFEDEMISAEEFLGAAGNDPWRKAIGQVYKEYTARMIDSNALDFDD